MFYEVLSRKFVLLSKRLSLYTKRAWFSVLFFCLIDRRVLRTSLGNQDSDSRGKLIGQGEGTSVLVRESLHAMTVVCD